MNILHLCTKDHGGAGIAAYRLHTGLNRLGIESRMLVMQREQPDETVHLYSATRHFLKKSLRYLVDKKITAEYTRYRHTRPQGLALFSDDRTPHHKLGTSRQMDWADIVHLHWVAGMVDYKTFFTQVKGVPIVWTLHDMNPFTGGCHYAGGCNKFQLECRECPQLGSKDASDLSNTIWHRKKNAYHGQTITWVAPSRWLAARAKESCLLGHCGVHVIPNGISTLASSRFEKNEARRLLKLPQNHTVILFGADNLKNVRKGALNIVKALNLLKDNLKYRDTTIAAFGKKNQALADMCDFDLVQLGHMPTKMMPLCYAAADMFVIASAEDNLPNTVLESMACGTPVVGFGVGGIPDMVTHGETGLLVEPIDLKRLSEMILMLLDRPEERLSMGRNGVQVIKNQFECDLQAQNYLALYRQMRGHARQNG